jgi:hypothetical protein
MIEKGAKAVLFIQNLFAIWNEMGKMTANNPARDLAKFALIEG